MMADHRERFPFVEFFFNMIDKGFKDTREQLVASCMLQDKYQLHVMCYRLHDN